MHTGAAKILDVMVQTLLGLAASLAYPDRSFLHKEIFLSRGRSHPQGFYGGKGGFACTEHKERKQQKIPLG